jgi:hypothetical protein
MAGNLRECQKSMISQMLVSARGAANEDAEQWRILVFDAVGLEVLSPIIKVKELRDAGVTLHLSIEAQRQPVPGVPAIYFCEPSESNIARIAQDVKSELYERFDVNFIAQVSRQLLESLAMKLSGLRSISSIRVVDRTLSFIALNSDLFSLTCSDTFRQIHTHKANEDDIDAALTKIVLGLSHVFLATDALPIVSFVRSGPAGELADRVNKQFSDLLREKLISPPSSVTRPLLLIVDRSYDLTAPLHHPFTYRGLLSDALGMALNKVDITVQGQKKSHELDPENDTFWLENAVRPFTDVSNAIHEALEQYKREYQEVTAAEGEQMPDANSADAVTKMLALAPKLAERKRSLDAHTTIAFAALHEIKQRELDVFHGVEDSLLRREELDRAAFVRLLKAAEAGKPHGSHFDKLRLLLLAKLTSDGEQAVFVDEQIGLVKGSDGKIPAVEYIKNMQAWTLPGASPTSADATSGWKFAQTLSKNLAKAFTTGGAGTMLPLTRLVDTLLTTKQGSAAKDRARALDAIVAMDPRTPGAQVDVTSAKFSSVYVFMLGGACMTEYDNLKQNDRTARGVVYGGTELLRGDAFLSQLTTLGQEA